MPRPLRVNKLLKKTFFLETCHGICSYACFDGKNGIGAKNFFFVTKLLTLKGRTPDILGVPLGKYLTIHNLQYFSFPKITFCNRAHF